MTVVGPQPPRWRGNMPHRLKVIEQNAPTVKEIIAQLAKAEEQEIQRLKREMAEKKSK
jgi:hypothetical protein